MVDYERWSQPEVQLYIELPPDVKLLQYRNIVRHVYSDRCMSLTMGPIDSSESFIPAVFSVGTLNTFLECTSIPSKSE